MASPGSDLCELDDIDRAILRAMREKPRSPVAEIARLASVARGTAHARVKRLEACGVVVGYGPDLNAPLIGYRVLAFVTVAISQGQDHDVVDHLCRIQEVLEIHSVTGPGDLFCRVVARSNEHLDEILQAMLDADGVSRTETQLVLGTRVQRGLTDLVSGQT